jgi:hypothetical protein
MAAVQNKRGYTINNGQGSNHTGMNNNEGPSTTGGAAYHGGSAAYHSGAVQMSDIELNMNKKESHSSNHFNGNGLVDNSFHHHQYNVDHFEGRINSERNNLISP